MVNILIISPLALENRRGGEISTMELAKRLHKSYNVKLLDSNIFMRKKVLLKEVKENDI